MGPIVADGSLLVTGRGSRPRGLISINKEVIFMFIIVILSTLFLGGKHCVKHYFGCRQRFYQNPYKVFPHLEMLANNFELIEREFLGSEYKIYDWPEEYLYTKEEGHDWKVVPLYGFGVWNAEYSTTFPKTIELIRSIPGLRTAIFSKLGPRTELNKHRGWSGLANEALRCHMGIVIPDPDTKGRSGVAVEDEFRQITKGEWIVFDDSKEHIGVNDTDENRVVLLLDIERPWWVKKGESKIQDTPELLDFVAKFTRV